MKNEFKEWFKSNMWNLAMTATAIIVAWAVLNFRVDAMEKRLAQYPSQDYFELKFKTIDDSLNDLEGKLDKHITK